MITSSSFSCHHVHVGPVFIERLGRHVTLALDRVQVTVLGVGATTLLNLIRNHPALLVEHFVAALLVRDLLTHGRPLGRRLDHHDVVPVLLSSCRTLTHAKHAVTTAKGLSLTCSSASMQL